MAVKVTKNTKTVKNIISVFEDAVATGTALQLKKQAEAISKLVKDVIYQQLFKLHPLSPKYFQQKVKKGLDLRILIATGDYVKSIKVLRIEDKELGVIYQVGFPKRLHKPSKLTFEQLAYWLEFGTKKMPARPHWRVVWARVKVNFMKGYVKDIHVAVLNEFRRNAKASKLERIQTLLDKK